MSGPDLRYKRMVVGVPQSMPNLPALQSAASLAEFLHIELLAALVGDAGLLELAAASAARELDMLGQQWRTIDPAQLSRDVESAVQLARRGFAESVSRYNVRSTLDIVTGADAMASLVRADDIVAVIEPHHPGERITRQFTALLDAAFGTEAAVLAVPHRVTRTAGPVLALAAGPDDPSIRIALEIAAALKERLIAATRAGARLPQDIIDAAQRLGVPLEQIAAGGSLSGVSGLAPSLTRTRERLRVTTRSALSADIARLFADLHGVPLLVTGSDREEPAAAKEQGKTS